MTGGFPNLHFRASAALPVYQRALIFEARATKTSGRITTMVPLFRLVDVDCVSNHG